MSTKTVSPWGTLIFFGLFGALQLFWGFTVLSQVESEIRMREKLATSSSYFGPSWGVPLSSALTTGGCVTVLAGISIAQLQKRLRVVEEKLTSMAKESA